MATTAQRQQQARDARRAAKRATKVSAEVTNHIAQERKDFTPKNNFATLSNWQEVIGFDTTNARTFTVTPTNGKLVVTIGRKFGLSTMQAKVNGSIQMVPATRSPWVHPHGVEVYCNEEALLIGMDKNPMSAVFGHGYLTGPLVCFALNAAGNDAGGLLTPEALQWLVSAVQSVGGAEFISEL